MATDLVDHASTALLDAAVEPSLWQSALAQTAVALGVAGVGCVIRELDGSARWATLAGLGNECAAEYTAYYAPRDPWGAVLDRASLLEPIRLSHALAPQFLRQDEWYNEYVRRIGIEDILGVAIDRTPRHSILFALHSDTTRLPSASDKCVATLSRALRNALRVHRELQGVGWKSAMADVSLARLASGMLLVESDGKVVEANRAAAAIMEVGDGLELHGRRIDARRAFDAMRLAQSISNACAASPTPSRMTIGRTSGKMPYVLTITPLNVGASGYVRPLALILVASVEEKFPSQNALKEFFGLSPAEARITVGLMSGKPLADIARDCAIRISTARTQLSATLKKVGVRRQVDLLRVLAALRLVEPPEVP